MQAAIIVLGLTIPSTARGADDPPKEWEFVGRTQAVAIAEARAHLTGYVTHVAVKTGDAVKKGDLLVEIDPRAYQLDLEGARARLKVAAAKLQVAKIKSANTQKLQDGRVVSSEELALSKAAEAEAEATLAAAKVDVERAELTLSWTRIVAPFDGRVSRLRATEGGLVTAAQTPILTVVATDTLAVSFNVPEGVLLRLRRDGLAEPGKLNVAVGFALDEAFPHPAKLELIEPQVDPETGTVRFRATVPNPKGHFLPGMSAHIRLTPMGK